MPVETANQPKKKAAAYKEGPGYQEGDASAGRIEPKEEPAILTSDPLIAARDRRAYLVDQAVKNESANDELNAHQIENNKKLADIMKPIVDPDEMRDESVEASIAELDEHTPEAVEKAKAFRKQLLAKQASGGAPGTAAHGVARPAPPIAPPPPKDR